MLIEILNLFKFCTKPYKGSSDTFVNISKTIKDEFARENINLSRIMSLLTVLESLAVTQSDGDIIKRYQTQFKTKLDRMR